MKNILLFGAGKSATLLIDYLLQEAAEQNWKLWIVDTDEVKAREKLHNSPYGEVLCFNVQDEIRRQYYIETASIVISLLPPHLHIEVARDCLQLKRNLLTASYVDAQMEALGEEVERNGLLFLCEMGLDPGLDHMSAKKLIDDIRLKEGVITSFLSHCGGLVAPESDNNPWHYKITWNPRNVVLAGKSGAAYRQDGQEIDLDYVQLFSEKRYVLIPGSELLCWYPNRDSLNYAAAYKLQNCPTFARTTLRHPDFMYGWKNLIDLKLTDETLFYETDGKTLMEFFREHMERNHFSNWLENRLQEQFQVSQKLLSDLMNLAELEQQSVKQGEEVLENFMMVDAGGNLQNVDMEDLKSNAAATIAFKMHEARLTLRQLFFLGMDDDKTLINKGRCSAADVLQFAMEKKMALLPGETDMVVMMHEIEYRFPSPTGEETPLQKLKSTLIVKGEDETRTAMAKTVGLPLGVAAKLILNGRITLTGLQIPAAKEIYVPVMNELKKHGIVFTQETEE